VKLSWSCLVAGPEKNVDVTENGDFSIRNSPGYSFAAGSFMFVGAGQPEDHKPSS
jgi:hypothetical protein